MFGMTKPEVVLPPVPWQPPPAGAPAPRPALTREAIVDAGLALLEGPGAEALTMRGVAQRLGAAPASLYGHVANKEELIQLVLDRVFGEIPMPDTETDDWEQACRTWLRDCRTVMRRHPGAAGLTLGRIPIGPNSMVRMEAILAIARRAGLPDQVAAYVGDLFGLYLGASVYEEDTAEADGVGADDFGAMFRDWLASLPPEQFPNMIALAGPLSAGSVDDRFEWGMDLILRGLATYIDTPRGGKAKRGRR